MLAAGEFLPGQVLPSTTELAKRLGTYGHAVHKAMALLAAEGLVARKPHAGTVVTGAASTLRTIGVYLAADSFAKGWTHNYIQSIFLHLSAIAHAEGVTLDPFLDPRPLGDCEGLTEEFVRAARARKFQAIASLASDVRADWIAALGLPLAAPTARFPGGVTYRAETIAEGLAAQLEALSCRSAGIVTTLKPNSSADGELRHRCLVAALAKRGLAWRPEWLRYPDGELTPAEASAFGFQAMTTLWRLRDRPDGIAVFPDIAVPGVVCAALQLGLGNDRRPAFVFHKHRGNAPFCPFPATWLVSDPYEVAETMFRLLRRQIAGQACQPVALALAVENPS